jgi:hypothetical protein
VQPSSLVFLVIIAVWAAFFLQYWVRRREHLSTARSVDQFSEAMRVLERRSPLPVTDLSTPTPRSYAVVPARAARPQILVKRADTATASSSPSPAGGPGDTFSDVAASAPQGRASAPVARASAPVARASARRARALVMLGAMSTVAVALPLLLLGMLPGWVALVPVASLAVTVAYARSSTKAERRLQEPLTRSAPVRRSAPSRVSAAREAAHAPVSAPADSGSVSTSSVHFTPEPALDDEVVGAPAAPVVPAAPVAPRDELFDVQAVEDRRAAAAAAALPQMQPMMPSRPLVDEDDIPLTWDPVPVPRPTYTMKARVTRPAPTSADLVGDADTEYAAYEEPARRVAGA